MKTKPTGSERRPIGKLHYQAQGVLYLPESARFSNLIRLPPRERTFEHMTASAWSPRYTLTPAIARGLMQIEAARARVHAACPACSEVAVQKARKKLHGESTLHLYLRKCIY
ncbi:MAG: hypothetical protein WBL87_01225 [Methanothrix sp.]